MSKLTPLFQRSFPRFYRWLTMSMVRERNLASPFVPLRKPLAHCRMALISTGGFHLDTQPRFRTKSLKECSFREIPVDTPAARIHIAHDHYDHRAAEKDLNVLLPRDRIRELTQEGIVGSLAPIMISFMGAIMNPKELIRSTAPQVAARLKQFDVDAAILSPA